MRRLFADLGPLRESPHFRRLWAGSSLSQLGGQMTAYAVLLEVYQLTRSSAAVGVSALVSAVPAVVLGLVGASFADAVDRRRLVLLTGSGLAGVSALFALQAFLDLHQLWLLYLLLLVQSLLQSIGTPARRTFVPRLLPARRVAAATALMQLAGHGAMMLGPILAGVIAASGGLRLCYVVDVVSFAGALYGVFRLPPMPPRQASRPGLRSVADGLKFLRRTPVVGAAIAADVNAMVLGMPRALFPALNAAHFGGSAQTLGLLLAGPSIGGVLGSVLSGPVGHVHRQGRAMLVVVAVWGLCIAGFGLTTSLWLGLLLLAIGGAADTTGVVFRSTIVQTATPDGYRGRLAGVEYVSGAGSPQLGDFEAGVVGSLTTPAVSAVTGGLGCAACAVLIGLAVPAFWRYDARHGHAELRGARVAQRTQRS